MEFSIDTIKTEPCEDEHKQFPIYDIELEIKSEIDVFEIDDSIFLQGYLDPSREFNESNIYNSIEDTIIHDEIIKEDPVFYDPNENERHFLENVDKQFLIENRFYIDHQYSKQSKLLPKINWNPPKEKPTKKDILKEKRSMKKALKKDGLENKGLKKKKLKKHTAEENVLEMIQEEHQTSDRLPLQDIPEKGSETRTQKLKNQNGTKKPFACNQCSRNFSTLHRHKSHQRVHTNEKPFQCRVCLKFYNRQASLNVHMLIHTGERPFPCTKCKMKFRQKVELERHMGLHENRLDCGQCSRKFTTSQSLATHQRVHSNQKPFQCMEWEN